MRKQPKLKDGLRYFPDEKGMCWSSYHVIGRPNELPEEEDLQNGLWPKLRLFRMAMNDHGTYDTEGAYWGAGDQKVGYMYRACLSDGRLNFFVRALNRKDAVTKLTLQYPQIRFTIKGN